MMSLVLAAAVAALTSDLPVRRVTIPHGNSKSIQIDCPVGQLTRLVLPQRLVTLRASAGTAEALGVAAERSEPQGIVSVRPEKPARGTVEVRGPSLVLVIVLQGVEKGGPSEIRLTLAPPPTPVPTPVPTTQRVVPPSATSASAAVPAQVADGGPPPVPPPAVVAPAPAPSPEPAHAPAPSPPEGLATHFDLEGFRAAKPAAIGRREGLPGEPEMVLDAAFRGERSVWLRFFLRGGARARVARVSRGPDEVTTFVQEPAGQDLRIDVQLPKDRVDKNTRITIKVESGGTYRFALSSGTFADFLKGLFR